MSASDSNLRVLSDFLLQADNKKLLCVTFCFTTAVGVSVAAINCIDLEKFITLHGYLFSSRPGSLKITAWGKPNLTSEELLDNIRAAADPCAFDLIDYQKLPASAAYYLKQAQKDTIALKESKNGDFSLVSQKRHFYVQSAEDFSGNGFIVKKRKIWIQNPDSALLPSDVAFLSTVKISDRQMLCRKTSGIYNFLLSVEKELPKRPIFESESLRAF